MDDDDNKDKRDKVGPISGLRRKMTRRLGSASGGRSKMKREKTLEGRQGFRPGDDSDTRLLSLLGSLFGIDGYIQNFYTRTRV